MGIPVMLNLLIVVLGIISRNGNVCHCEISKKRLSLSAAALFLCGVRRASGVVYAAARGIRPAQHGVDYGRRAADASLHGNRVERTIPAAGAALHARVSIPDLDVSGIHFEHPVGTDLQAHPAAGAFFLIKFQRNDIF
jgi:hypothetical protein